MKYGWTFRNAPSLSFGLFCLVSSKMATLHFIGYTFAAQIVPEHPGLFGLCIQSDKAYLTLSVTVNRKGAFWSHTRAQVTQVKGQGRDGIFVIPVSDKRMGSFTTFFSKKNYVWHCLEDFEKSRKLKNEGMWETYHKYHYFCWRNFAIYNTFTVYMTVLHKPCLPIYACM